MNEKVLRDIAVQSYVEIENAFYRSNCDISRNWCAEYIDTYDRLVKSYKEKEKQ